LIGSTVLGVDVDPNALEIAKANVEEFELEDTIDLVMCDLENLIVHERPMVDTVLLNPPFGTRRKGIDMFFLQRGCQAFTTPRASISVHSLTKQFSSTSMLLSHWPNPNWILLF